MSYHVYLGINSYLVLHIAKKVNLVNNIPADVVNTLKITKYCRKRQIDGDLSVRLTFRIKMDH